MFPKLFQIGDFIFPVYGPIIAIGYLCALFLAVHLSKKEGMDGSKAFDLGLVGLVSSIIGAKLLYLIVELKYFIAHPEEIIGTLRVAGVFYGGLLLGIPVCFWYIRKHKMGWWKTADNFAPSIALGQSIGRIGCLMAGCCYGKECHLPWAVTFTDPVAHKITNVPLNVPVHPSQLYMSMGLMVLFAILMYMHKHKKFDGQIISSYLIFYGIDRFIMEFFRGDDRGFLFNHLLSTSQFISILSVLTGVVFIILLKKQTK